MRMNELKTKMETEHIQTQAPVQCEDQPNPNLFMVVYDNHSYEHHLQNEMMCEENEVSREGDAMIVWGEWSFPLRRSSPFSYDRTNNVAVTIEDEVEMDAPLNIVVQTEQSYYLPVPAVDLSDLYDVNPEFRRLIAYPNDPEEEEDLEGSEKEDSNCDSLR